MINKETLEIFYFIETIDKMYFFPDSNSDPGPFDINLHIDDANPKNPRIVELFYFPYQKLDFRSLYRAKKHYSSFEMENDGKIYEIIDKSSPEFKEQRAEEIISFVDKDLEKARETVYRNIKTLVNIYAQALKGLENINKAVEKGKDLHILKKLWFDESLTETDFDFDLENVTAHLNYMIDKILSALHKLTKLKFEIQEIQEIDKYTIRKEIPKKLYEIKVGFVAKNRYRYAYYNIQIDDDKIKVSIEVEYEIEVLQDMYKSDGLAVFSFGWPEWFSDDRYLAKATKSWYYFLRPEP